MIRLGLTGSIASGKSEVSRRLREVHGAYIVDADQVSRELVLPKTEGLEAVLSAFGEELRLPDGSLDRKALGRIVFADEKKREQLNAILHPRIFARIEEKMAACPEAIAVLDAPLLIEGGLYRDCDLVWLVEAPEEIRIKRIIDRDGLTEAEAKSRIAAQMPDEEKRRYADVRIENTGTLEELEEKVDRLWQELKEKSGSGA